MLTPFRIAGLLSALVAGTFACQIFAGQIFAGPGDKVTLDAGAAVPDSSDPLHVLKDRFYAAGTTEARGLALRQMETALATGATPAPTAADGMMFVAHRYYQIGQFEPSLRLFRDLATLNDAELAMDASRMVGQIEYLVHGDRTAAEVAFRRVTENPAGVGGSPQARGMRMEALSKLSEIYTETGRHADAIAARQASMELQKEFGDTSYESAHTLQMARDMAAIGLVADSKQWYARAASAREELGDRDGMVLIEMELARSEAPDQAIDRLAAIWHRKMNDVAAYYTASFALSRALFAAGEDVAAVDVLRSIDAAVTPRLGTFGDGDERVAGIHEDSLLTLAVESANDGDLATRDALLARVKALYPDSVGYANLMANLDGLGQ